MNIWAREDKPLLVLAPMAGYTDSAFREICRGFGADIVMTELISADAIYHNNKLKAISSKLKIEELINLDKTLQMMKFSKKERPIVVQLFGKYPEKFAFAAKWVAENIKPDGIDINMGCPARKVVGSDHGAALLKNHALACEIVKVVRESIKIPLSVKSRLGWESDDEILDFAPKLVEAGADALIIHGRTYRDGFRNGARWENIYKVRRYTVNSKRYTAIVGNGDVGSYQEAMERAEAGNIKLDGVAIGRKSFGNPMIFSEKLKALPRRQAGNSQQLKAVVLRHAKLVYERKSDHGIIEFRKHLLAYLKEFAGAKELRGKAVLIESFSDVESIVKQIK